MKGIGVGTPLLGMLLRMHLLLGPTAHFSPVLQQRVRVGNGSEQKPSPSLIRVQRSLGSSPGGTCILRPSNLGGPGGGAS